MVLQHQWRFRRQRLWCWRHLLTTTISGAFQDSQVVLNLEQAADMAMTPEEEEEQVEFGHPSPSDSYEALDEEDKEPPQLASRYVGVEDRDAIDVGETEVDRAGPSLAEVRSLGPIEELEGEMFDKAEREVPAGSGTMKEVFVCKFCAEEFNYMMRDMHTHKDACPKYPSRANLTREVQSVPDEENPEMMVDVEVAGEPANVNAEEDEDEEEVKGPDAPMVEDDAANKDEEERRDDDRDADMGLEPGEEEDEVDEDETQMLDDEPLTVVVPDRIEMPDETDQPRPVLKVATAKLLKPVDESRDVDMVEDVHSTSETEETAKTDARGRGERTGAVDDRDSPENASETASTGSAHGGGRDYRTSFRMIPGTEQAECLQCGRVCSNRGGAMASHYKKCPGQPHPTPDRAGASVQLITPKKKAAKRRISGQEYELLEEETNSQANESEDDSQPGSPPLRRSKRFKADSKGDKVTKPPTSEMESLELTVTPATTASTAVTTTEPAPKPTKTPDTDTTELDGFPLSEFDLVAHDKRLKCQHCHSEMVFREDLAEKHLGDCDAYKASRAPTTPVATVTKYPKRAKPADRDGSGLFGAASAMLRHPERLRVADILELDHDSALTWIFGSYPIERMRSHYGKSPMVVRSPVARFRAIEGELCELNVAQLLTTVPQSTPITAMVPTRNGGREYKMMPCTSPSTALGMYEMDAPLVWRAPLTVAQLFVPHFAKELRCGPMVATNMHKAELLCVRERLRFDWQYHKMDSFVVCLRGKALWKLCGSGVELPPTCFHVSTTNLAARERMVAMQAVSLGVGSGRTTVPVPTCTAFDFGNDGDGDEDMDTGSPSAVVSHAPPARDDPPLSGQQMVSDAGSVIYIPAGTWYYVDGLEGDTVWLQFRMKTVAVGDVIVETVQQLVAAQCAMRERLVDLDGDAVAPQKLAISRMREIGSQLMRLSANEVLPELLFTNETPLATIVCDVGDDRATKIVTYDLRNPSGFQGGRDVHFFKRSTFRVTLLAALLRADELPPLLKNADAMGIPSGPPPLTLASAAPATASKKALHRKNKRTPVNAASVSAPYGPHPGPSSLVTSTSNGTAATPTADALYILYQGMGGAGDGGRARLKVQFWCNAAQQGMIEWIRSRDTADAFRVSELAKVLAHHQGGRADFELLKMTVRFLCVTGYLTNVDVPI